MTTAEAGVTPHALVWITQPARHMVDIPAIWQLRQLQEVIAESPMADSDFRFSRVNQGGHINSAFRFTHAGYADAEFFAEWMDLYDPTGQSGPKKGDYHVEMQPGRDGPYERHNYIAWGGVVEHFRRWVGCLAREFGAAEDWGQFVELPRLPPAAPPSADPIEDFEIRSVEPLLLKAEAQMGEVVEERFATRQDIDDLRTWLKEEFADIRRELLSQSKRGFRRSLFGFAANIAMKFGPDVWQDMTPIFESVLRAFDSIRVLPGPQ